MYSDAFTVYNEDQESRLRENLCPKRLPYTFSSLLLWPLRLPDADLQRKFRKRLNLQNPILNDTNKEVYIMKNLSLRQLIIISFVSLSLYMIFLSIYIKDEMAPISKVAPLYILSFTLLIFTHMSVKNVQNRKNQIILSLIIFVIQFGLGLFLMSMWFRPRSDYVLAHQAWLTHLKVLASQHYMGGFIMPFGVLTKRL